RRRGRRRRGSADRRGRGRLRPAGRRSGGTRARRRVHPRDLAGPRQRRRRVLDRARTTGEMALRVADWLMDALVDRGVEHAFMVTGGGAMHLNDAAGAHPRLTTTSMLHEQAAAIAAETYTKASGRLALCLVTTGPGA